MDAKLLLLFSIGALAAGCSPSVTGAGLDLSAGVDSDGGTGSDAAAPQPDGGIQCDPASADKAGCPCDDGPSRACYDGPPATRNMGLCHPGTQTCTSGGEFNTYGMCMGQQLPVAEDCTNKLDDNCDGKIDCLDPNCATNPVCNTGCTDGDMRPCYDGPQGTQDVGICHGGMQTCANGMWPNNCPGEQLPEKENCTDAKDHDCNHLPGCLDLFSCLTDPACQNNCSNPDPGCTCPMGSGDTALCPGGTYGKSFGNGFNTECCPCTANDCGNPGCCAEQVCKGNQLCNPFPCTQLPAMCKGMVNADCDDFPEDCDEPCCPCTSCN